MDPTFRSNHKSTVFWKRITADYNDECDGSERTPMDLTNRWTAIDEAVLKFSGFYQQAQYTQFNAVKKKKKLY